MNILTPGLIFLMLAALASTAAGQSTTEGIEQTTDAAETTEAVPASEKPNDALRDLSEEAVPGKFQRENLMVVPIPMSSPTFGTGVILGGAYFYPQTEAEKAAQPASFTAGALGYTTNDSWVVGAMQKNYWAEDKWRFVAVGGYADFKLELFVPESEESNVSALDWNVDGGFFQTSLHRRISGNWYGGALVRYLDMTQDLDLRDVEQPVDYDGEIRTWGIGLDFKYDSRDLPGYPFNGHLFEASAITSVM